MALFSQEIGQAVLSSVEQEVKELKTPWTWSWEGQSPFQGLGSAAGSDHAGPLKHKSLGFTTKCSYFGGCFVEELNASSQCAFPTAAQGGRELQTGLQGLGQRFLRLGSSWTPQIQPGLMEDPLAAWECGLKKNKRNCIFHTMEVNSKLCQHMWWDGPDSRVFLAFSIQCYLSYIL